MKIKKRGDLEADGTVIPTPPTNNPYGSDGNTRRFSRNLANCARERMPATVLLEYLEIMMAGHRPIVTGSAEAGWSVDYDEQGEIAPTISEMNWAWTQYRQAGHGLPVQSIVLDADLRQHAPAVGVDALVLAALPHAAKLKMQAVLREAIAMAKTPRMLDVGGDPAKEPEESSE